MKGPYVKTVCRILVEERARLFLFENTSIAFLFAGAVDPSDDFTYLVNAFYEQYVNNLIEEDSFNLYALAAFVSSEENNAKTEEQNLKVFPQIKSNIASPASNIFTTPGLALTTTATPLHKPLWDIFFSMTRQVTQRKGPMGSMDSIVATENPKDRANYYKAWVAGDGLANAWKEENFAPAGVYSEEEEFKIDEMKKYFVNILFETLKPILS
jgi:hypothetical protein